MAADIRRVQDAYRAQLDAELAAWRVRDARQQAPPPAVRVRTPATVAAPRERRDNGARTAGRGGDSGDDDDGPSEPWALSFVDRAPSLWRARALRCRLLEIREGVER